MKEITVYETFDGERHNTIEAALAAEAEALQVQSQMDRLKPRPSDNSGFTMGDGYIQQYPDTVNDVKLALQRMGTLIWNVDFTTRHISHLARYAGDGNYHTAMSHALYRLQCIDDKAREWGQPYYCNNPRDCKFFPL